VADLKTLDALEIKIWEMPHSQKKMGVSHENPHTTTNLNVARTTLDHDDETLH
jgi:hypothetical protein